ncbi:MAG: PRTRC system protein E [Nitrospiraceae bacterium]|nr:MAG: PRTRC system protein E [Nitrospiraceae bacterium]
MIIDFKELSALVPEKGSLILTFKRSNGKMTVCYAPRYDGKEENSDFRPVTVTGTPEDLNEEWSKAISEIAKNERLLAEASSSSTLSKRKTETEKALSKTSKTGTTGSKKTDDSSSASGNNLFTPAKKEDESKEKPAENKADDPDEANKNEGANTDLAETSEANDSSEEIEKPQDQKTSKPTIF